MEVIEITKGSTYTETLLWLSENDAFLTATGATMAAPAKLTITNHGLLTGQPIKLECVTPSSHPLNGFEGVVEVEDANTLILPTVNAHCYPAITGTFVVRYGTRFNLTGYVARMQVRTREGTLILDLTTENGGIAIDPTSYEIAITVSAAQTAALTITRGVFDLEVEAPDGEVTKLTRGAVVVRDEVTK